MLYTPSALPPQAVRNYLEHSLATISIHFTFGLVDVAQITAGCLVDQSLNLDLIPAADM